MMKSDSAVSSFIQDLRETGIPLHSVLMASGKTVFCQSYCPPYQADTLHRMFSVTKSFVSLAVGFLEADGLISLSDQIIRYFPEYLTGNLSDIHPWLAEMTIGHMLKMETCHSTTAYDKFSTAKNWVESFFTTSPDHKPGTVFQYDTSSTHTLAALVEKLTGKRLLNYLREKCLDSIGFSREAYILPDPFGISMGGSGLMALPSDLLKFGFYLMDMMKGEYPISDFIRKAVSFQTATVMYADIPALALGYGYQFWRLDYGGFACYGMGGQFLLMYPKQDLICVTTADTQGIAGGCQCIFNAFYNRILKPVLAGRLTFEDGCSKSSFGISLPLLKNLYPPMAVGIYDKKVWFLQNHFLGCDRLCFDLYGGTLTFSGPEEKSIQLKFCLDGFSYGKFPIYNMNCAAQAAWIAPGTLYIRIWILDTSVGSVHIQLHFSSQGVTVFMNKAEETLFREFTGYLYGV